MIAYTKTTATGTDDCIVLEPRADYCRLTTLPDNWKTVRIGAFLSVVGLGGPNDEPVAETLSWQTIYDPWYIGLSNGAGAPQEPGARFVGIYHSIPKISWDGSIWTLWPSDYPRACVCNGANSVHVIGSNSSTPLAHQKPSETGNFAAFLGLQVAKNGASITAGLLNGNYYPTGDVSSRNLLTRILTENVGSPSTPASTASWWTADTDIGLKHLYIRAPYRNNRLRLHALEVVQLA